MVGRYGGAQLSIDPDSIFLETTDGVVDEVFGSEVFDVSELLGQLERQLSEFIADTADDSRPVYDAATARGAAVVIPPRNDAIVGGGCRMPCAARDRTVERIAEIGRREWKKVSGYHRQGTVENSFFRYKSLIGDRLRARHPRAQRVEALIACNVRNRMFEPGRPVSKAIRM